MSRRINQLDKAVRSQKAQSVEDSLGTSARLKAI